VAPASAPEKRKRKNNTMSDFHIYHRDLPHWRQDGAVYFVTWRLHLKQAALSNQERDLVLDAIRHFDGERYAILIAVVMDDHVHVLVYPREGIALESLCHTWKSFTANQLQRKFQRQGAVWQKESFDRIPRQEREIREKATYILNNPFKRWPEIKEYKWLYPQPE
jgi:REP element-mobilizing transposase RayT